MASAVHAYGKTGDPHMRALIQHILGLVSHPILNFLYRWIYDGELEDTYHEVRTPTHTLLVFAKSLPDILVRTYCVCPDCNSLLEQLLQNYVL